MSKILVLDIETTGWLRDGEKIVELGIVVLDLTDGSKEIVYDKVFNPGYTAEQLATKWICIEGYMSPEEILAGHNIKECLPEIQAIIDQYPNGATAFNRSFDVDYLKSVGVVFNRPLPCPMLLSTPICKRPHARGGSGYKWPKVQEAWDYFFGSGTGYVEKHRGADDAFHEADIVFELYKKGVFKLS